MMTTSSDLAGDAGDVTFPDLELSQSVFKDPLKFIYQEHRRHKKICNSILDESIIDRLCYDNETALIKFVYNYFLNDLPNHILDEERDLFPLMKERSKATNNVKAILHQVCQEHEFDKELTDFILKDLERLSKGNKLSNPLRLALNLQTFAEGLIRHTNWENLTILPVAESLLTEEDLVTLGKSLAKRRNVDVSDFH
jgi:hemerythrin-like domain-containing protein